jgi:hypothetical protein
VAWGDDFRLTDDPNGSHKPSMALDRDGNAHVIWQDGRDGNYEIYWRYWYSGTLDPPVVTSIEPDSGETGTALEMVDVVGTGFHEFASVWFENDSGDSLPGYNVIVSSPESITCDLNLGGGPPGHWDVVVRNFDGQEGRLVAGFLVLPGPWGPDTRLTSNTSKSYTSRCNAHCVVADPVGNIHVVWYDGRNNHDEIYYKLFDGVTWSGDERLTDDPDDARYPSIAWAPGGELHLVWTDSRDGFWNIYYKRFDGMTWGSDVRLAAYSADQSLPCIAVDADKNLHVVWYDNRNGGNDEIYYRKFDGMTWGPETRLTSASGDSWTPAIVADDYGNLHVAWHDHRNNDYEIYYKRFNGAIWEPDQRLTDAAGISANAALSIDITGKIHLTWNDNRTGNHEIYRRILDGVIWGGEEQITDYEGTSKQASAVCDNSGNIHVAWQDNRGGEYAICHKVHDGVAWTDDSRLTPTPSKAEHPSLAADLTGRVHIVWHDTRDGNEEIYYRLYDPYQFSGIQRPKIEQQAGAILTVIPNPTGLKSQIEFTLGSRARSAVRIYDTAGRLVWSRDLGLRQPGPHSVTWDGTDISGKPVSPGVYFVKVRAGNRVSSAKLVVIR